MPKKPCIFQGVAFTLPFS